MLISKRARKRLTLVILAVLAPKPSRPSKGCGSLYWSKDTPFVKILFVAVFLSCTSTGRVGLCFLWFFVQELPKAQPAVVLVLKRLRRRGNGLKSHPIDWEKPGIEPATPGLQDIGLSPTPRRLLPSASLVKMTIH